MKITFHGAAQTVTGSQHLLSINGQRVLLDCGLYQGQRKESFERNRNLPFQANTLNQVVLSHAHIDHAGNLPSLLRAGYAGEIIATHATGDMSQFMLRDSAHIQESDVAYVNKQRRRQGKNLFEPLYTKADAEAALAQFRGQDYETTFEVAPGVTATFYDAGHILGSAITRLEIEEHGRRQVLVFSGDIGRENTPILRDPTPLMDADILIMESTYGGRHHGPREEVDGKLAEIINRTVDRGGKVVVPAFAVGRTQEIVYALHRLMEDGQIPRIPVFVDSPLASNISQVYRRHHEIFDEETLDFIGASSAQAALKFPQLTYIVDVEDSKALNDRSEPMVIISASGMCETGRILHHLRHNISDARNTVLIVSYQAPHTLGRRLQEGQDDIKIFGEPQRRRAEVATISGFSAHADHEGLINWVGDVAPRLKHIFLVHGDLEPATALRGALLDKGALRVDIPAMHESAEV